MFLRTNLTKPGPHGPCFLHRALSCWDRFGPLSSSEGKLFQHTKEILYLLLPVWWQQFGGISDMGVMVRRPRKVLS